MPVNRFIRKTASLGKIEATYGVDATPTGVANAMLVSNVNMQPFDAETVDRALLREYFGGSEQLAGVVNQKISYDVELAGSGAAGTAPAWGPLLRASGAAETITAGNRVEYNPITDNPESATLYFYDSGVVHKLLGARGNVRFNLGLGGKPVLSFSFIGLHTAVTAAAVPAQTLTAFKKPLVVTNANSGDVTLGCTYSAGSLVGGTPYPSAGVEMDAGQTVEHVALLGDESIDLNGRGSVGSVMLGLTAAQEVSFLANVQNNDTQGFGFVHGVTAGNIITLFAPAVQLTNYKKAEFKGRRMIGYDLRFLPLAGNDDWLLCVK